MYQISADLVHRELRNAKFEGEKSHPQLKGRTYWWRDSHVSRHVFLKADFIWNSKLGLHKIVNFSSANLTSFLNKGRSMKKTNVTLPGLGISKIQYRKVQTILLIPVSYIWYIFRYILLSEKKYLKYLKIQKILPFCICILSKSIFPKPALSPSRKRTT